MQVRVARRDNIDDDHTDAVFEVTPAPGREGEPTAQAVLVRGTDQFDGTPQLGTTLPIVYDEFGVESRIPDGKAKAYTGTEPATTKPVDEIDPTRTQ